MSVWATTVSLVERLSLDISWAENLLDEKHVIKRSDGKIYAKQPPAAAFLAAPIYAIARIFLGNANESNIFISWFILRLWLSTLPLLFLAYWLYKHDTDEISLGILLFANPILVYSLLLSTSVLAACLIYFAFRLVYDPQRIFLRYCLPAGFICGAALFCFPSSYLLIIIIGIGIIFAERQERLYSLSVFASGILPFVVFLLIYDYFFAGSLLYRFEWESFGTFLYTQLISPKHGLFFYTPILFFSLLLLLISHERRSLRHRMKTLIILGSLFYFCLSKPSENFVLEEFVLLLPFLMDSFFDGELYDRSNLWLGAVFTVSLLFCLLPALNFPFIPEGFKYPHNTLWPRLLLEQKVLATNLTALFGLKSNILYILPVLTIVLFAFYQVLVSMRKPQRFFFGAVIGLIIAISYLFLLNLDKPELRQQRSIIAERYF